MMPGVARGIHGPHPPTRDGNAIRIAEHLDALGWDGQHFVPEAVHLVAIDPAGASQETGRVGEMRSAAGVREHPNLRILAHERPSGTGVIEVDVREQN